MDSAPLQGELQQQVMHALWAIGSGGVEQVRAALPEHARSAYNTVQTVLNRLVDRGLLQRERSGRMLVYRPLLSEAEYLSGTVDRSLAGASEGARRAVLASLLGSLDDDELDELRRRNRDVEAARRLR